jgi:hypothetical protein
MGKFLAVVKSAVGDAVKVAAAPLQNTKGIDFRHEEKLYSTYLKTAIATSGINSNLIYNSDLKPNAIETQLSLNTDEMLMTTSMYPQFEAFLNFNVNRQTKFYKFKFLLEGTNFFNNSAIRQKSQVALMDKGIVLHQKIAAAHGMSPFDFERQLMETRAMGFVNNLTPIVSGFQVSKDSATNGRPQKEMNELKDSGVQTREDGGNVEKGSS